MRLLSPFVDQLASHLDEQMGSMNDCSWGITNQLAHPIPPPLAERILMASLVERSWGLWIAKETQMDQRWVSRTRTTHSL